MRLVMAVAVMAPVAAAAADLNFQARLLDATGAPMSGPQAIELKVYQGQHGEPGVSIATAAQAIAVDGVVTITATDVPAALFVGDPWLGLVVNTDSDAVPRRPVTAAAYTRVASRTLVSTYGQTPQTAAPSCAAVRQSWPAATTGVYYLHLPGDPQPVAVWCEHSGSDAWLDIVKTLHLEQSDVSSLVARWFVGGGAVSGAAVTGANGAAGVLLTSNEAGSHAQAFYFRPSISTTAVRTSWRLQGSDDGYRCSHENWVPLSGPGYDGDYNGYFVACLPGFSCVQGRPSGYRDAPISASYANNSFDATRVLLTWSGSNTGPSAASCSRDPNIPASVPALFITDLRIQ